MRTSIDLPDELFRHAKALSSLRGITLKALITRALEHELESATVTIRPRRVRFPIVPSSRPGWAHVTSDRIAQIMEVEDADISS
ncbi:MAG: hypothetical protein ACOCYB_11330 [Alkalispirochaeta sp.]